MKKLLVIKFFLVLIPLLIITISYADAYTYETGTEDPKAILLYGDPVVLGFPDIEDDMRITSPVIPGWDETAQRSDSIFIHDETGGRCNSRGDSCTEIQVTESGTYRVIYGLTATKGSITQNRYQAISFVQNDTDGTGGYDTGTGLSCFDSSYTRTNDNILTAGWSGECLVELEANGKVRVGLSKISSDGGSDLLTFSTDENWFQMQKVENPTISLRATGASFEIDNTGIPLTFVDANVVTNDNTIFSFDGSTASDEITVEEDGFYKVSYSALHENPSRRSSVIGKIQTNATGSFVDDIYGGSIMYNRNTDGITQAALSSSAILELHAKDAIRIVLDDETVRTSTATDYHLDIEYIGTRSFANVLRIYDSAGGVDLDVTGSDVLINWDASDEIGSHFTFTGDIFPPNEITIENSGLYHISYGIDSHNFWATSDRFGQKTRAQIDIGGTGTWVNAEACFGDGFARGRAVFAEHITATATSSCMLELEKDDKIRVSSLRESDAMPSSNQLTLPNKTFLTIQSLPDGIPAVEDFLGISDEIKTSINRVVSLEDSISLSDGVISSSIFKVFLNDFLSFKDSIETAFHTQLLLFEFLSIMDYTEQSIVKQSIVKQSIVKQTKEPQESTSVESANTKTRQKNSSGGYDAPSHKTIKEWITTEENFRMAIFQLISQKLIDSTLYNTSGDLPKWIYNLGDIWSKNQITDEEFYSTIEYLIDKQVIQ